MKLVGAVTDTIMADEKCANCGHSKFDHAISLKGVAGACQKEIIKNWEYCDCEQFQRREKEQTKDV